MKKPNIVISVLLAWAILGAPQVLAEHNGVTSLRGHVPLEGESKIPTLKKWVKDDTILQREYVQQPPLIPHSIKGYKINVKFNKCLTCHSWANYREAGATKISQTHFADRENNVLANVAPRRYFCTQCHVPQANARPLVENTFESLKTIRP
jgi:cytochrome c-type protein NapB